MFLKNLIQIQYGKEVGFFCFESEPNLETLKPGFPNKLGVAVF